MTLMASQVGDLAKVTLQLGTAQILPCVGLWEAKGRSAGGSGYKLPLAMHEEGLGKTSNQGPGGGALMPKCTHDRDSRSHYHFCELA